MSFDITVTPALPQVLRARPTAPVRTITPAAMSSMNWMNGGFFRITGTVKAQNTPLNTPLRRRVMLLNELNHHLVAATWSDAVTGEYVFDDIRGDLRYLIIAYDHTGLYRAVIADNITAQPRP